MGKRAYVDRRRHRTRQSEYRQIRRTISHDHQPALARVLSIFENALVTLSCITPASTVFIIIPIALAGTGVLTLWSFLVAALIGVAMALCWSELGSAHGSAGGDYQIVTRALGPGWGFITLSLQLALVVSVIPLIALGIADYLQVLVKFDAKVVAWGSIGLAAAVAVLKVRIGAWITGVFLLIELVALGALAVLGFMYAEHSLWDVLFPPTTTSLRHNIGMIMAGVAVAIFAYDGYRAAVNLSEETVHQGKGVAPAILWALLITVIAEVVPLTAIMMSARSLSEAGQMINLTDFVAERGRPALTLALSLAVAVAILNALAAILIVCSRFLYGTTRDQTWPSPINAWLSKIHLQYQTPWIAVLAIAIAGVVAIPWVDLLSLGNFIGAAVTLNYMLIGASALVSRMRQPGLDRPYRMPWWPLPPLVALLAMAYVIAQLSRTDLWKVSGLIVGAWMYYKFYFQRDPTRRWWLKDAAS